MTTTVTCRAARSDGRGNSRCGRLRRVPSPTRIRVVSCERKCTYTVALGKTLYLRKLDLVIRADRCPDVVASELRRQSIVVKLPTLLARRNCTGEDIRPGNVFETLQKDIGKYGVYMTDTKGDYAALHEHRRLGQAAVGK